MGNDKKTRKSEMPDDEDALADSTSIPYNDPRLEKSRIYHTVSKWQKASVKLTQAKIDLENLLEEFDEHERKDERYSELFNTVEFMLNNIKEHYKPPAAKVRHLPAWLSIKNALITLIVAIIATVANNLENIFTFIHHFFK
jgi:hypothetical protein